MTRSFGATGETSQRFVEVQRRMIEAVELGDRESAKAAAREYSSLAKERAREILARHGGAV